MHGCIQDIVTGLNVNKEWAPARAEDTLHTCISISSYTVPDDLILSYIIPCFPWGLLLICLKDHPYSFPPVTPYIIFWGTRCFSLNGASGGSSKAKMGLPRGRSIRLLKKTSMGFNRFLSQTFYSVNQL